MVEYMFSTQAEAVGPWRLGLDVHDNQLFADRLPIFGSPAQELMRQRRTVAAKKQILRKRFFQTGTDETVPKPIPELSWTHDVCPTRFLHFRNTLARWRTRVGRRTPMGVSHG